MAKGLVEYGDYECPNCKAVHALVQKLRDEFPVEFRNFPISNIHPHAQHAAEAAECARAQGKFWPMHDMLFEHQDDLEDESLLRYAQQLGLDMEQFRHDFTKHLFAKKVKQDFDSGLRAAVNGTPTFFINDERYDGSPKMLHEVLHKEVKTIPNASAP